MRSRDFGVVVLFRLVSFFSVYFSARKVERNDVDVYYIPATQLASDNGLTTLANMIIMGKVLKETNGFGENVRDALSKVVSAKHADMLDFNLKALELGKNFE